MLDHVGPIPTLNLLLRVILIFLYKNILETWRYIIHNNFFFKKEQRKNKPFVNIKIS
jgi:hypothetical protein